MGASQWLVSGLASLTGRAFFPVHIRSSIASKLLVSERFLAYPQVLINMFVSNLAEIAAR